MSNKTFKTTTQADGSILLPATGLPGGTEVEVEVRAKAGDSTDGLENGRYQTPQRRVRWEQDAVEIQRVMRAEWDR